MSQYRVYHILMPDPVATLQGLVAYITAAAPDLLGQFRTHADGSIHIMREGDALDHDWVSPRVHVKLSKLGGPEGPGRMGFELRYRANAGTGLGASADWVEWIEHSVLQLEDFPNLIESYIQSHPFVTRSVDPALQADGAPTTVSGWTDAHGTFVFQDPTHPKIAYSHGAR